MTNKPDYNALSRKELQNKLVYGDIPKLEKLLKCDRTTIYRWFDGKTDRDDIKQGIISLLEAKDIAAAKRLEELQKEV